MLYKSTLSSAYILHIIVISVRIALYQSHSIIACSNIFWQARMPECHSLRLMLKHSYALSTYNSVWTSQYSVFCIQIFDIRPLSPPPNNSRSTTTSRHVLTLHPTLQRLVQCFTNISTASSLRQAPKSSHINSHPTFSKSPEYFAVTSNKFKNKNPPTKAVLRPPADECSSPIRQTSSMQAGNPVCR